MLDKRNDIFQVYLIKKMLQRLKKMQLWNAEHFVCGKLFPAKKYTIMDEAWQNNSHAGYKFTQIAYTHRKVSWYKVGGGGD